MAIIPSLISSNLGVSYSFSAFTADRPAIAISVAFDLVQKINSHLVMRNYKIWNKGDAQCEIVFIGPPGAGKASKLQRW